jgi:hypothetical protein
MKLKGLHFVDVAEIQEAVTDELKKVQKEEFSTAFQKLYDCAQKPVYMPMELIFNKNVTSSSCVLSHKSFGLHCACRSICLRDLSVEKYCSKTVLSM